MHIKKKMNKHNAELQWKPPPAKLNILYTQCIISHGIIILDIPLFIIISLFLMLGST